MQQKGQAHSLLEASMVAGRRCRGIQKRNIYICKVLSGQPASPDKSCKGKNNSQQTGWTKDFPADLKEEWQII